MKKISIVATFVLLVSSTLCFADTIHVPGDQPGIQAGIDAAANGDIVLVAPGTYLENINFHGKAITVKSVEGAASTVIDGGNPQNPDFGSTVRFTSGEGNDSVLKGFHITNGVGTYADMGGGDWDYCGGGVYSHKATPTIVDNAVTGNSARYGGGLYFNSVGGQEEHLIENCYISNNHSEFGGGMYCNITRPVIKNCIIENHENGGGMWLQPLTWYEATIKNNIIRKNYNRDIGSGVYHAGWGGGICCQGEALIEGNIITENLGKMGGGLYISDSKVINNITAVQ